MSNAFLDGLRPGADYRGRGPWICRAGELRWICTAAGKPHLLDGSMPILDPEFDWPDETWVAFHFETHDSIGIDPYDSRPLLEPSGLAA